MEEVRHKISHTARLHLHDTARIGKSIETKQTDELFSAGNRRTGNDCLTVRGDENMLELD